MISFSEDPFLKKYFFASYFPRQQNHRLIFGTLYTKSGWCEN